ncbi:MAG: YjbQ family protein [Deltaproteobacteria bacterium]|nr:YjbQ family protein [Deltaproteobacteria bacterium]
MPWHQKEISLKPRPRGLHLITHDLTDALPMLKQMKVGLLHVFIQHTSASLSLNENADPDVRADMRRWLDRMVPENASYFEHTTEGPDDMPAHVKAVLLGAELTIPIRDGRLALGTWQGIYLGEHRDAGGPRTVVATLFGD